MGRFMAAAGSLAGAMIAGAALSAGAAGCEPRDVYLVPNGPAEADAAGSDAGPVPFDASRPNYPRFDGGIRPETDGTVACGPLTLVEAKRERLGIYAMVDRSASMWQGLEPRRWDVVAEALKTFVARPEVEELELGIEYFPQLKGLGDTECDPAQYATPAVNLGLLSENAPNIVESVDSQWSILVDLLPDPEAFLGATPTNVALRGAIAHLESWKRSTDGAAGVVLLVTDGQPEGSCGATLESATQEAALGADAGILTFVLGVGESLEALDELARAGGTDRAFLVSDDAGEIVGALNAIRDEALPCTLPLDDLGAFRSDLLNVELKSGESKETFFNVEEPSRCRPGETGWYYDDAASPTAIQLCSDTCRSVRGKADSTLQLRVGCPTNYVPTR